MNPPPRPATKFNMNRAQVVDENFVKLVREWRDSCGASTRTSSPLTKGGQRGVNADEPILDGSLLTRGVAIKLFESQIIARHQDIMSREMRARNEGFYTIGSAGHEGNAVVGRLTRYTDIAFLHYRSGAFMSERARQIPALDFVRDTMLSFAASSEDQISGGRHKVWGSRKLWVPPQTSTIASHLPKSVGAAVAISRAKLLNSPLEIPHDSIAVCSFGDASVNHAVAQTAFNFAAWSTFQKVPVPILFVCEDNGIGISVQTPHGWVESSMKNRPGFMYFQADGLNLVDAYDITAEAVDYCRAKRSPVFLHMKTVRLLGHAGSDAETEYHTFEEIESAEALDPLLSSARIMLETGTMSADEILDMYENIRSRVKEAATYAAKSPKLTSAKEIITPLAPLNLDKVHTEAKRKPTQKERIEIFGGEKDLPENGPPRHMAVIINQGLHDILIKYPESFIFGEDVAKKGGVYHVTTGLFSKFGAGRIFNTLLDETTILGLASGAGHLATLPIPEIQYLAYYHNAEDQVRGEACSLQFFSKDQFRNPMVIRINGWGYQKGFGGHFHNDNSIAALRDVPGLIICTPSRGDDAVKMMRTCMALAKVDGRVVAFIEPIALYMTKDLYEAKDQQWSFAYPPPGEIIEYGQPGIYHEDAKDMTIFTFANGVHMSLRAAKTLREKHKINARVIDLRWLNPLNEKLIVEESLRTKRVLVVDEGRRAAGVSESILSVIHENCRTEVKAARLNALDTYVPLGPAADLVIPSENDVVQHALALIKEK